MYVYSVLCMERTSVHEQYTHMLCPYFRARRVSGSKQRTLRKTMEQGCSGVLVVEVMILTVVPMSMVVVQYWLVYSRLLFGILCVG